MLECLLYNSIDDKFQSQFEDEALGSFKYGFQLGYQVDISLHFMDVTIVHHLSVTNPHLCAS